MKYFSAKLPKFWAGVQRQGRSRGGAEASASKHLREWEELGVFSPLALQHLHLEQHGRRQMLNRGSMQVAQGLRHAASTPDGGLPCTLQRPKLCPSPHLTTPTLTSNASPSLEA